MGAAAEKSSGPPLKPYPKVADTKDAAANNGAKRPATVSASTQTDPAKTARKSDMPESASWDHLESAQTEWGDADQNSKPGLLGRIHSCFSQDVTMLLLPELSLWRP